MNSNSGLVVIWNGSIKQNTCLNQGHLIALNRARIPLLDVVEVLRTTLCKSRWFQGEQMFLSKQALSSIRTCPSNNVEEVFVSNPSSR